jgi:hypothetical protein
MDQKFIMFYLGLKRARIVAIYGGLVATLTSEVVLNGSITLPCHSGSFTGATDPNPNVRPDLVSTESNEVILTALEERPFLSVYQLA